MALNRFQFLHIPNTAGSPLHRVLAQAAGPCIHLRFPQQFRGTAPRISGWPPPRSQWRNRESRITHVPLRPMIGERLRPGQSAELNAGFEVVSDQTGAPLGLEISDFVGNLIAGTNPLRLTGGEPEAILQHDLLESKIWRKLRVHAADFRTDKAHAQRADVFLDDVMLASWRIAESVHFVADIPASQLSPPTRRRLRSVLADAIAPASDGLSSDQRICGFRVYSVSID